MNHNNTKACIRTEQTTTATKFYMYTIHNDLYAHEVIHWTLATDFETVCENVDYTHKEGQKHMKHIMKYRHHNVCESICPFLVHILCCTHKVRREECRRIHESKPQRLEWVSPNPLSISDKWIIASLIHALYGQFCFGIGLQRFSTKEKHIAAQIVQWDFPCWHQTGQEQLCFIFPQWIILAELCRVEKIVDVLSHYCI